MPDEYDRARMQGREPKGRYANATQADRIARLRERVKQAAANDWDETDPLPGILQGVLDLIADGGDA